MLTSDDYQPTAVNPNPRREADARLTASPNPTRGGTRVAFALPTAGRTRVALYDVGGREVRVLADGDLMAGPQQLMWDGRDSDGRTVASGVYLCRISAGGVATLARIAVVR